MEDETTSGNNLQRPVYEIRIRGELDRNWQQWFSGLDMTSFAVGEQPPTTTLVGPVADQAALRGMLCRLWDLNLTLISLRRIDTACEQE
jgi:hypothetical protein